MPTYRVKDIIDGQPTFEVPLDEILSTLKHGGALKVLDPNDYITERQRAWYKGVCIRQLAQNDENGETEAWWDDYVKRECKGLALLKKEAMVADVTISGQTVQVTYGRLTTKGVGKRNMTNFIEEILSEAMHRGWPVSAPDPELRRKQ